MNAKNLTPLFYTADNGNVCIHDDRPDSETVKAMVFAADQSGLGWDFAYKAVRDALQYLADTDESDEILTADRIREQSNEFADTQTDVCTADLVNWLASAPLKHLPLCNEAFDELCGQDGDDLEQRIRLGQYHAYELAMQAVADNWIDDEPEGDEDEQD